MRKDIVMACTRFIDRGELGSLVLTWPAEVFRLNKSDVLCISRSMRENLGRLLDVVIPSGKNTETPPLFRIVIPTPIRHEFLRFAFASH